MENTGSQLLKELEKETNNSVCDIVSPEPSKEGDPLKR